MRVKESEKRKKKMEVLGLIISVLLIVGLWRSSDGCLDSERIAFLQLNASFGFPDRYNGGDCCQPDFVVCNSSTGRVTQLDIHDFYVAELEYFFNASLFLPFHQLTALKIQGIDIGGCVHNGGFEKLSELKTLETLDLGNNYFKNKSILSSIGSISSLRSLRLYSIELEGTDEIQGLLRLENLEYLNLGGNNFNNSILSFVSGFSSLKSLSLEFSNGLNGSIDLKDPSKLGKLEYLDLSGNDFSNCIPLTLPGLPSLHTLYLVGCGLKGTIDIQELMGNGTSLKELSLAGNEIESIGGLLKLEKLEILDLTGNNFGSNIQFSPPALPFLHTLRCHDCGLKGTINIQEWIGNGTSLKTLSLENNEIETFIGEGGEFKSFHNLENLSLDHNPDLTSFKINHLVSLKFLSIRNSKLQGSFDLDELDALENLEVLDLSGNQINKLVASRGLCKLEHLKELDISSNQIAGTLPWCMANFTSLKKLDLSWNNFNQNISRSPLRSLTSLEDLKCFYNQFQVPFSLEPFFNLSKLLHLDATDNQIYDDEVMGVHNMSSKFQLETLYLSSHGNGGAFPKFLYHQHNLQDIDLSNIQLKGEFPYWLLENNTQISTLYLANTSLFGPFLLPNDSAKHLELGILEISNNCFNGTIPIKIGQVFPNLQYLNLSVNGFMGGIPSSLVNMRSLTQLDLSYNRLSGKILENLFVGHSSLIHVILSHNHLQGQILSKQADCSNLKALVIDDNQFTGNIPNSLLNCTQLSMLDASDNQLSGTIPGWIANISSLQVLDLSNNSFFKNLPSHLCSSTINEVYLSNNQLQGSLGNAFYNCFNLMTLDLSHNYLNGNIPRWIGELPVLRFILLSYNNLQGELPIEFCNLDNLRLVDLSNNNLSGSVLFCLRLDSKFVVPGDYRMDVYGSSVNYRKQSLEFTTKSTKYKFQGSILKYISGIDLSCNNFTSTIPDEFGSFSKIQVLNLSHNSLTGQIPQSFSNLSQIESLDLSYNNMSGRIPPQLTQLNFLSKFNVSHNNLSGMTPELVKQFATFDDSSYEGNPYLCGPPLLKSCQGEDSPLSIPTNTAEEEDDGFMDMTDFYLSFFIAYATVLLSMVAVLYINPYWRRAWFYIIEVSMRNCYYFLEDNVFVLIKRRV